MRNDSLLRFLIVGVVVCTCLVMPSPARSAGPQVQGSTPTPPAGEPPSLFDDVVDVRVVNIEAVVTDRRGGRVPGLGAADFRLTVDGKEVPVQYFTEIRDRQAVAGGSAAGLPSLDPGEAVATNYLVYIDDYLATRFERDLVLHALEKQIFRLGPADRMAVVAFDGHHLDRLSSWTGAQKDLARTLAQAQKRQAFGIQREAELHNFTDLRNAGSLLNDYRPQDRLAMEEIEYAQRLREQVGRSVAAASNAMRAASAQPGRKVLLLLASGWPFSVTQYVTQNPVRQASSIEVPTGEELYGPLVNTANRLGYTIYPVDVKGIQKNEGANIRVIDVSSNPTDPTNRFPGIAGLFREQEIHSALQYVALETGGRALIDADRTVALERAEADTRSYYWLGFAPQWQGDDELHKIRVEVLRPGLEVRSRESFVDLSRKAEVGLRIEGAMLFGPPEGSPRMMVKLEEPVAQGRSEMDLPVTLGIPVAGFTPMPVDGHYVADLVLHVYALDDQGRRSDIPVVPIRVSTQEAPEEGKYVSYSTRLRLRRTHQHLVLAVFDPVSGKISTAEIETRPPVKMGIRVDTGS